MVDFFKGLIIDFSAKVIELLPKSPFRGYLDQFANISDDVLGWLNWLIPIKPFLQVAELWLGAIAIYYVFSTIMRWIRLE